MYNNKNGERERERKCTQYNYCCEGGLVSTSFFFRVGGHASVALLCLFWEGERMVLLLCSYCWTIVLNKKHNRNKRAVCQHYFSRKMIKLCCYLWGGANEVFVAKSWSVSCPVVPPPPPPPQCLVSLAPLFRWVSAWPR